MLAWFWWGFFGFGLLVFEAFFVVCWFVLLLGWGFFWHNKKRRKSWQGSFRWSPADGHWRSGASTQSVAEGAWWPCHQQHVHRSSELSQHQLSSHSKPSTSPGNRSQDMASATKHSNVRRAQTLDSHMHQGANYTPV